MSIDAEAFVAQLLERCPELTPTVEKHLGDDDEVLLHVLVADVRRFALAAFAAADQIVVQRVLDVLADGLRLGDDRVENAVAISFCRGHRVPGPGDGALHLVVAGPTQGRDGPAAPVVVGPHVKLRIEQSIKIT